MLTGSKFAGLTSGRYSSLVRGARVRVPNGSSSPSEGTHKVPVQGGRSRTVVIPEVNPANSDRVVRRGVGASAAAGVSVRVEAKPRVVVGWRTASIDQELDFSVRSGGDLPLARARRLGRVLRCCVFGESWADALEREERAVFGKVKVPRGLVTSMVKAFCALEGWGRG